MSFVSEEFIIDRSRLVEPVLVTGAGGCIGAWVLGILAASGARCVAFDLRDDRRRPALVMGEKAAADLTWETGDIADAARLNDIVSKHRIGSIIHLAGLQIPFCKADPAAGARVNVVGTINILEAARSAGIRRTAYASSTAAHGMPPGGKWIATLYGAYKLANEQTAGVYWIDWEVPSVGLRPNVVYGLGRDQGMTSKFTSAIQAAVLGAAFEIPYSGPISWLHAGEAASAFVAAISRETEGAPVFDLNGGCETVEHGLEVLGGLVPGHQIRISGGPLPVPPDLDDGPVRGFLGDYPSIAVSDGIETTYRTFQQLADEGRLEPPA